MNSLKMNNIKRFHVLLSRTSRCHKYGIHFNNLIKTRQFQVTSHALSIDDKALEDLKKHEVRSTNLLDEIASKEKADKLSFQTTIALYIAKDDLYRRGHVEFIYAALRKMKEFGVEKDLSCYKALLTVFPADKMKPKSMWQVELMHYPKQQQCAIDMMDQMEDNAVLPDKKFGDILAECFGENGHAFRKYRRIMYWIPKFRGANPYPLPDQMPNDNIQLAMLALKRMAIDSQNELTVWKTTEVEEEPIEDTFIVGAMSPEQKRIISNHEESEALFVEGGFTTWMANISQNYFILRADPKPENFTRTVERDEDLFEWSTIFEEEKPTSVSKALSIHEQDDGTILGMCITGTASKDSVVTWIRYLQQTNPKLVKIPVVFSIRSPDSELQRIDDTESQNNVQNVSS